MNDHHFTIESATNDDQKSIIELSAKLHASCADFFCENAKRRNPELKEAEIFVSAVSSLMVNVIANNIPDPDLALESIKDYAMALVKSAQKTLPRLYELRKEGAFNASKPN